MPDLVLDSGTSLHYVVDDFTDPWVAQPPETVLLIHGMAESHRSWFAWVPWLARDYRVVRVDLPGLGRSTIDLGSYAWSLGAVGRDLAALLDRLGLGRVHVVGAKIGGSTALAFAAAHPEHVATVTNIGGPLWPKGDIGTNIVRTADLAPTIAEKGVRRWAQDTMPHRLGPDAPPEQLSWWTRLMAGSDRDVLIAATTAAAQVDLRAALPAIQAPALLLTGRISGLAGDAAADLWATVPDGRREIVDVSGYHVAAVAPDHCAQRVLAFVRAHPARTHGGATHERPGVFNRTRRS
jgi:3-oxoadipate enol-lactonase